MPQINSAGLSLIQSFEGLRLAAYVDAVGVWTIGWGHTGSVNGSPIHAGLTITRDQADELLRADLTTFEHAVNCAVNRALTPNQFAACVSLAYNIGTGAFAESSVLRRINSGDMNGAADAFELWVYGGEGVILPGLVRRRAAEKELFLTP